MTKIFPSKLKERSEVRVISLAASIAELSKETIDISNRRFKEIGSELSFGKHIEESDEFSSSSIESRINDLHEAFSNPKVKMILATLGGFNSNQLLRYINWDLIRNNPKILCGYSDITALNNAIYAKTGLITYSGPFYSTFGQELYFDYTLEYFKKCIFSNAAFEILPSKKWTDDCWWENQKNRKPISNSGWLLLNEGEAEGTILGANLCTFNLLQGTEYFPDLKDSILFLEDDEESKPHHFDRDLQSLIHLPEFKGVKGIVIGRFQKASQMTDDKLIKTIKTKKELDKIPVIANVDFGHTSPIVTFPIGGISKIEIKKTGSKISIIKH